MKNENKTHSMSVTMSHRESPWVILNHYESSWIIMSHSESSWVLMKTGLSASPTVLNVLLCDKRYWFYFWNLRFFVHFGRVYPVLRYLFDDKIMLSFQKYDLGISINNILVQKFLIIFYNIPISSCGSCLKKTLISSHMVSRDGSASLRLLSINLFMEFQSQ